MKRSIVLAAVFGVAFTAHAQSSTPAACASLQTENAALKDKLAAYEARLGINTGGVTVTEDDDALKFKFVSCKASKSSHKASLMVLATNSAEPVHVVLSGAGSANFGSNATLVVDEQGQAYKSEDFWPLVGGKLDGSNTIPTNVPVSCTVYLVGVPTSVTRLNSATLMYYKKGSNNEQQLRKTTIRNIPVTWVP